MKCNIIFYPANVCLSQILNFRSRTFIRYYRGSRKRNPYEVLGLKDTCSTQDIKKAYIKLCKELHPDVKPGDTTQHKKFIELSDAYNDLLNLDNKSNNKKRQDYQSDVFWKQPKYSTQHKYSTEYKYNENNTQNDQQSEIPWYETEEYKKYYRQYDKKDSENKNYRKANQWVLTGCFVLMVLGSALYVSAYKFASRYTLENVDQRSKKITESLSDLRSQTIKNSKDENLANLKRKWSE